VARGYDGEVRSFALPRLAAVDWIILWSSLALLFILLISGILFFG
jgi:hypothetical protein